MKRSDQFLKAFEKLLNEFHLEIVEEENYNGDGSEYFGNEIYLRTKEGTENDAHLNILLDKNLFQRRNRKKRGK